MIACFQIHPADNVATLLDDGTDLVQLLGSEPREIRLREKIPAGHKVALADFAEGAAVVKFGVRIGHATTAIAAGAWVHLHNLASDVDARSSSLDRHTGAPTDTSSAYA